MLKLEKVRKSQNVTIRLREKERIFNRSFILAAVMAALFHLGAFVIFRIDSSDSQECQVIADPSLVDVDIHQSRAGDSSQSALAAVAAVLPHHILEPEPSLPQKPKLIPSRCQRMETAIDTSPASPNFHLIERLPFHPEPTYFAFSQSYLPLSLTMSSTLSERVLLSDGAKRLQTPHLTEKPTKRKRISFLVRLDDRSGRLFWFEKEKSISDETDRIATAILKRIRFAPLLQERGAFLSVTVGIIEMTLEIEEGRLWDEYLEELEKT